jgi:hypothetical protein
MFQDAQNKGLAADEQEFSDVILSEKKKLFPGETADGQMAAYHALPPEQ